MKPPDGGKEAGHEVGSEDDKPTFTVHYDEGLKVGYKWYDAEHKPVLFPFGYGLSYTRYEYKGLKVTGGASPTVTFSLKIPGSRAGAEIAEIYVALPAAANEPPKRLAGFTKSCSNRGKAGN